MKGLRLLPRVLMKVDELKREKRAHEAMAYLNCQSCMSDDPKQYGRLPAQARSSWRCGWMPESERARRSVRNDPPDWGNERTDVCPGYLIRLPQVQEAANAHTCWKEGQLQQAYPNADISVDSILMQSVLELNQALGEAEADALAKIG